jgi:predicted RNase H-like HicB family nuclease
MKYLYTAVISQDAGRFVARVPDLPGCVTCGRSVEEAIDMATDAASGWLVVAEDEGVSINPPTPQADVRHEQGDILTLVRIDTIKYRAATDNRAVRKNVSLPMWLARLADQHGVNCSQVLQEGLLARFNT